MRLPSPPYLRQLYTLGSLENTDGGIQFQIKNRLFDASLIAISAVQVDDDRVPLDRVVLEVEDREVVATEVSPERPVPFPLRTVLHVRAAHGPLDEGIHRVVTSFSAQPFGELSFAVEDAIVTGPGEGAGVPRDRTDNYSTEIVAERRRFVERMTGVELEHVSNHSFEPALTQGNVENFLGVAQVPIGLAGPLRINGEHAQGDFLIPLATTEGTLVASYNRGMKVLNASGGVTCSVVDDCMQRAPVFIFDSAREARDFKAWVNEHTDEIRKAAEATTRVGRLLYIDTFLASRFAFLRFNFSTGDAAGQNMVGRATFAACSWILEQTDTVRRFYLESNFATDKKDSQVNIMRTRGKRVTAEVLIPRQVLMKVMRVPPESLHYHGGVANVGAFLAGANNNGLHSPNAITAMFIATGQDVANVAEAAAGVIYTDLTPGGDFYVSMTIPSLIVATYGGGTALPTQRECLRLLGCDGPGTVGKLAEIVAGVVLAGEISLASAISSLDWVSSHEMYGRNR